MFPRYLGFEMVIGKKANPQAVRILVPIKKASCLQFSIGTEHTAPVTVKGNRGVSKAVVSYGNLLSGPDQKRFIQPFEVVRVTEFEVAVVLKEDGKIALYGPGLQDVFLIGKVVDIKEGWSILISNHTMSRICSYVMGASSPGCLRDLRELRRPRLPSLPPIASSNDTSADKPTSRGYS